MTKKHCDLGARVELRRILGKESFTCPIVNTVDCMTVVILMIQISLSLKDGREETIHLFCPRFASDDTQLQLKMILEGDRIIIVDWEHSYVPWASSLVDKIKKIRFNIASGKEAAGESMCYEMPRLPNFPLLFLNLMTSYMTLSLIPFLFLITWPDTWLFM